MDNITQLKNLLRNSPSSSTLSPTRKTLKSPYYTSDNGRSKRARTESLLDCSQHNDVSSELVETDGDEAMEPGSSCDTASGHVDQVIDEVAQSSHSDDEITSPDSLGYNHVTSSDHTAREDISESTVNQETLTQADSDTNNVHEKSSAPRNTELVPKLVISLKQKNMRLAKQKAQKKIHDIVHGTNFGQPTVSRKTTAKRLKRKIADRRLQELFNISHTSNINELKKKLSHLQDESTDSQVEIRETNDDSVTENLPQCSNGVTKNLTEKLDYVINNMDILLGAEKQTPENELLKHYIEHLQKNNKMFENENVSKNNEIQNLNDELKTLKLQIVEKEIEKDIILGENVNLKSELETLKIEKENELENKIIEINEKNTELEKLEQYITSLKNEIEQINVSNEDLTSNLKTSNETIEKSNDTINSLQLQLEEMKNKIKFKEEDLSEKIISLKNKNKKLVKNLTDTEIKMKQIGDRVKCDVSLSEYIQLKLQITLPEVEFLPGQNLSYYVDMFLKEYRELKEKVEELKSMVIT